MEALFPFCASFGGRRLARLINCTSCSARFPLYGYWDAWRLRSSWEHRLLALCCRRSRRDRSYYQIQHRAHLHAVFIHTLHQRQTPFLARNEISAQRLTSARSRSLVRNTPSHWYSKPYFFARRFWGELSHFAWWWRAPCYERGFASRNRHKNWRRTPLPVRCSNERTCHATVFDCNVH